MLNISTCELWFTEDYLCYINELLCSECLNIISLICCADDASETREYWIDLSNIWLSFRTVNSFYSFLLLLRLLIWDRILFALGWSITSWDDFYLYISVLGFSACEWLWLDLDLWLLLAIYGDKLLWFEDLALCSYSSTSLLLFMLFSKRSFLRLLFGFDLELWFSMLLFGNSRCSGCTEGYSMILLLWMLFYSNSFLRLRLTLDLLLFFSFVSSWCLWLDFIERSLIDAGCG